MSEHSFTRKDVYEIITSRILAALEQGTVPWHQPWTSQPPANLITRKPYRGVNVLLLGMQPVSSPWWATYRQVAELGGHVRKGEHGTPVVFWKWFDRGEEMADPEEGAPTQRPPILRYYTVFSADQCDGIAQHLPVGKSAPVEPIAEAEAIVAGMPNLPHIEAGPHAAYSPPRDVVIIPDRDRFVGAEAYHATLFHELAHSTGHPTRLNRPTLTESTNFGSEVYTKEELVAELAASFLCAQAGITNRTLDNSASYIGGWLKKLSEDRLLVVHAAAAAQKAADYILGDAAPRTPSA